MKTRKSRISILFFGCAVASWLGLPSVVIDENNRNLQEDEQRTMYTFDQQIKEDIEETNFKKVSRIAEEKEDDEEFALETDDGDKPVMYTFYEKTPNGCCGMTAEGHEKLLNTWSKAWESRGWETKVLTKADAERHPDFKTLDEQLKKLHVGEYNRRCYWRWLAMATLEDGGWMSDYDLFPLQLSGERGKEIAQDEAFKSFGLHVPCLIHASREEWDRIIQLMISELPSQQGNTVISDMYSLLNLDIAKGRSGMQWSNQVAPSFIYSSNSKDEQFIDCNKGNKLAVHLSHSECDAALKHNRYPLNGVKNAHEAVRRRGEAAEVLMIDYENHCLANDQD